MTRAVSSLRMLSREAWSWREKRFWGTGLHLQIREAVFGKSGVIGVVLVSFWNLSRRNITLSMDLNTPSKTSSRGGQRYRDTPKRFEQSETIAKEAWFSFSAMRHGEQAR